MPIVNPDGYVVRYTNNSSGRLDTIHDFATLKLSLVHLDCGQAVEKKPTERRKV